ncbi:MAG TPA: glycosyltransferase family 4 protein [Candidatus Saccharimonadales bacterium]|jgi:glycosyltransferase involved in cell wall biosynthesis|nr:glycosyltransferase family 4 protein [Candidatus Saccharimonadales bacterium]
MNILFISPNSPLESVGGVERYIANLTNYCKDRSQFNTVIVLPTFKESSIEETGNLVTYFDENIAIPKNISDKEKSEKAHLFSKTVENIIIKHKIDIICAENFHRGLPPAYCLLINMVAGLHKIPLVLRLHSFAVTDLQVEIVNQLMWNKLSCISESVAGDCFQKGANVNFISTDYLGVDTSEFNKNIKTRQQLRDSLDLPPESKIILTASRIIGGKRDILQEKGIINLIQAFSKLVPHYPKLRLLIAVGKPPDNLKVEFDRTYEMLLGHIKLHNVEGKTIIKMFKLNEMPEVYGGSDVFALPSENETFGQVFIEAMACGLPVIGTKVGGIPEIISDSSNGYLIPPNDSSVLAQMMEKLINDRSIRNRFIKAGIKTVEDKFTSEKQLFNFMKMLEETVSGLI